MAEPEVWLRGPVPGYHAELQPAAHALLQAREDLARTATLPDDRLEIRAGDSASIGYHLRHLAGSLDRLCTYARGEQLSQAQLHALRTEATSSAQPAGALVEHAQHAIDAALAQLRATPATALGEPREVGRGKLPSTVRGLLFHAAEHTTRHVGQVITLMRVLAR
jgi:uncharacterized damage-inducible protein DinB